MKLHVSWSFECWELFAVFCELFTSFGDTGKRSFGGRTNKVSNFLLTLYGCSDRRTYNKNKTPSALRTKLIRYTIKKTTLDCNESEYEEKFAKKLDKKSTSTFDDKSTTSSKDAFKVISASNPWTIVISNESTSCRWRNCGAKIYKQTAQTSDESSSKT